MVFRVNGLLFDIVKTQYPWIEVIAEDQNGYYHSQYPLQEYHYTQLILSRRARIPFLNGCQEMPWVKKLTIYLYFVSEQSLNEIKYLSGLEDLGIDIGDIDLLQELCKIGLGDIPIKKLRISVLELIHVEELQKIIEIFDLEKITAFQLHLWDVDTYPENFSLGIQELLSALVNVTSLSIICQNIDFGKVLESVKPNSLHTLHLKIVQVGDDIQNFQLENLFNNQEHSLQQFYLSNKKPQGGGRFYGLQEFERIYKKETKPLIPNQQPVGIFEIRRMIDDGKFQKLNRVLINESCYFIKRLSNGMIHLVPCNSLIPDNP
ncbi:uncharacterized protein SPAPADRAFT_52671 [Spathaspora passalidarum NRRL Y-27907]|uniref:Uncharacterized protein n=1 Tax=Spathaspora passalidarum (strain NRRL Y-27907 / 11-Y1) TaxID=619300 RepID=G3AUP7_SPAPN|nr:uncharacterized protein SPAPADRAFT_52671 [Spathaspora passalidarum NRRL Y-27907]EGW30603.1 hypothetical protein SPAPADRAFT_52671 [Spathaspora passalidarum NRRL Y-27907]